MMITMGDFNAKIGPQEHDNENGHVGMYGQGERSDNGDALVEFAIAHDLRMMNTIYSNIRGVCLRGPIAMDILKIRSTLFLYPIDRNHLLLMYRPYQELTVAPIVDC